MSSSMSETIKVVADGGGLVVLVFVLAGMGYLAVRVVPAMTSFFAGLTARHADVVAKQAATDTKVDALIAASAAMSTAIARFGEIVQGSVGKAGDVVQEEARETREAIAAAESRITRAVRREQASDPPSRPSFTATPPTGLARTQRVSGG